MGGGQTRRWAEKYLEGVQTAVMLLRVHCLATRGDTMNFFRGYAPDGPCQAMTALLAEFFFDNPKL